VTQGLITGHAVRVSLDTEEFLTVTNVGPGVVYYGEDYGTTVSNYSGTIASGARRTFHDSAWVTTDLSGTSITIGRTDGAGVIASSTEPQQGYAVWMQVDPTTGELLDIATP
jgi:hypothetical protein